MRSAGTTDGAVDDAAIVVTELLTNAIRHASPLSGRWLQVTWDLENESVEIAVSDGGSTTLPRVSRPALSALGGRGLEIVETLSQRWGVRSAGPATTVWAILAAPCLHANGHLPA
jgi:two-component sensor histidine kinase